MLTKIKFAPGIDKQDTSVGAEGRWVDSDNVRFRYGLPEKVGGWQSLLTDTIVGVARKQHAFVDTDGNRYVAIGTDKFLLLYFEGQLFDITPLKTAITGATFTFNGTTTVTLTTSADHGIAVGDIIRLSSTTLPGGTTGVTTATFDNINFQVLSVPSSTTLTIQAATAGSASSGGSVTITPYEVVGPAAQSYGYGFGIGNYGGTITGVAQTTLDGALNADTAGTGGSGTSITVDSTTGFDAAGTILVGNELITYTSKNATHFLGITRGTNGTATAGTSNGQAHSDGTLVQNATLFTGFGSAVQASTVTLEPGLWSLSNFGEVLVATIANGKTFTWNAGITARLTTRASTTTSGFSTSNNPTATRVTLISPTTRHLIHFGTETTIGTPSTQDDMFIRFSVDEDINNYTPEATNTAGTQRLQDGTKIMGALVAKENILVWTDNALYAMKFVGAPFTFGFEQVGTNCGLIGKNAAIEIDGVAYWMGNNGFFSFDGTVNTLPCSVEDFVYDDIDTTKGQQICAGINNLFTEVVWWYPTASATYNDRYVVYNYGQDNANLPMGNWYTGTNTNSIRTTWIDSLVFPKPYATAYNSSTDGTFPLIVGQTGLGRSVLFEHEIGTDQVNPDGSTTALTSFVQSFSFSLQKDQSEIFLAMRRFLPNFKVLTGNNNVTIAVSDFPATDATATALSPFTITSTTTKVDTRARGRYASIKIENTGSGESWRFGTFQVDLQPDGRRG
ncbi:MAG: hypothetical protein CM15mV131_040 [uncultured marine virus]|nr:MAG: hypothetical protein CM15mV131_040 [uncultured marine virus]